MLDAALLVLRVVVGLLFIGHGAQKLFGWFGGGGLKGTAYFMESLGLTPGRYWALLAGLSEFVGGLLVLIGLLNPVGSLAILGAMIMATVKAHWGKPIWSSRGGAELPIVYGAIAVALLLTGYGRYSLDNLLKISLPGWVALAGLLVILILLVLATIPGVSRSTKYSTS